MDRRWHGALWIVGLAVCGSAQVGRAQEKKKHPFCHELKAAFVVETGADDGKAAEKWMQDTRLLLNQRFDMKGIEIKPESSPQKTIEKLQKNKLDLAIIPATSVDALIGDTTDQDALAAKLSDRRLKLIEMADPQTGPPMLFLMSPSAYELSSEYRAGVDDAVKDAAPAAAAEVENEGSAKTPDVEPEVR